MGSNTLTARLTVLTGLACDTAAFVFDFEGTAPPCAKYEKQTDCSKYLLNKMC